MKNQNMIAIVLIIAMIFGAGVIFVSRNNSSKIKIVNEENLAMPTKAMMEDKKENSRYVPYSQSALSSTAGRRKVLFFFASWCSTCRPANASFVKNASQIPADVTVIRVNFNDTETDSDEKALAQKYKVTYQHTFVQIDSEGQEITKWNGGELEELLANIK